MLTTHESQDLGRGDAPLSQEVSRAAGALWERRRFVLVVALVAAGVAAVMSLCVPETYRARSSFLSIPRENSSLSSQLAAAGAGIPGGLLSVPNTSLDVFSEVLESRALGLAVVDDLGLVEAFHVGADDPDLARRLAVNLLREQVSVAQKPSGLIAVHASMSTSWLPFLHPGEAREARVLAAEIANSMIGQLNIVLQERRSSSARNSREYLESQMTRSRRQLEEASDSLVAFQKRHATLSIEEQARVTVEMLGTLQGQIVAKEVELDVIAQSRTPGSYEYRRARTELDALRSRYRELLRGSDGTSGVPDGPAVAGQFEPVTAMPEVAMELLRRTREVELQHQVQNLLTTQYYQALLDEARDTPTVQVLDEANPPLGKSAPQRKVIVVLALAGGFLLASMWVLLRQRATVVA